METFITSVDGITPTGMYFAAERSAHDRLIYDRQVLGSAFSTVMFQHRSNNGVGKTSRHDLDRLVIFCCGGSLVVGGGRFSNHIFL